MTCCYISRLVELEYTGQWHCRSQRGARYQSPHWLFRAVNQLRLSCVFQSDTALFLIDRTKEERERVQRFCFICLYPEELLYMDTNTMMGRVQGVTIVCAL